jgi:uncharacterized protein YegL
MSLLDKDLEQLQAGNNYKFSATKISGLGASEYTLASIVVDASSSVAGFAQQLEDMVKTTFKACDKSPRRDNLMLRVTEFADTVREIHGFKQFTSIKEDDYTKCLQIGGSTALFEAVDESINCTSTYGKQLAAQEFLVNAIIFILTDGENNRGTIWDPAEIGKSLEAARRAENLESITVVLVGVTNNTQSLSVYLQEFKDKAGITQYIDIGSASAGKLAKLADFVSKSISNTSSSLGTGQASQPINSFKF